MKFAPTRGKYRWTRIDYVEDVDYYIPGGYHPVDLGNVLCGKCGACSSCSDGGEDAAASSSHEGHKTYRIIHKLGHGSFATIWLARALHDNNRLVAVKVLRATVPADCDELAFATYMRDASVDVYPGIISLIDGFSVSGPNGQHQCLVFPFVGPSVDHIKVFRPDVLRSAVFLDAGRQLANAVAHLHAHGIVHGDISSSNVLLEAADSASWTDDDIYEYFGEPHTDKIFYASGKRALEHAPRRIVEDVYYSAFDAEHFTGRIVLADFGVAFRTTAAHGLPAARAELPAFHPAYLAPELLFGCAPSPASDVWALACVLFELIGCAGQLFPCVAHGLAALGALPQAWRGATSKFRLQWLKRRQDRGTDEKKNIGYWLDDSKWYDSSRAPERPLDKLVAERLPWFSERETAAMLDLLRGALVYEPQKRVSAAAIAAHPFLDPTLWGMPVEQDDEPDYTIGGS